MADDDAAIEGADGAEGANGPEGDESEMRPCAFCGAMIHPSSGLCHECGGNVSLAWGTAHKEHFLFLLASILIAVGCFASWAVRSPGAVTESANGFSTIRGSFMFALAVYGVITAILNVLYRRLIVWPFLLNALVALWVGIAGIVGAMDSKAWEAWKTHFKSGANMLDGFAGQVRAIPPGFLLLSAAGGLVMISLLKGVVAGAAAGSAKDKAKKDALEGRRAGRAAKRGEKDAGAAGDLPGGSGDAGAPPPIP